MLTLLSIEDKRGEGIRGRIRGCLCVNSLKTEERYLKGIGLKHIIYKSRNGRVNWRRIKRRAADSTGQLVYSGEYEIPRDSGLVRFYPRELRQRLCVNAGIEVLRLMRDVPKNLRVGLYDPLGEAADASEHLLKFTDNLVVVTDNIPVYELYAGRMLSEYGAALCLSRRIDALQLCGLVIAPAHIDTPFMPSCKAVVLTCTEASVPLPCLVYHSFSFETENCPEELFFEGVDRECLAGALYSLCGCYRLGSLVPSVCKGVTDNSTVLSLSKYLQNHFGT